MPTDTTALNGLLSRRQFFALGLGASAFLSARSVHARPDVPAWQTEPGEAFSNYGAPSQHERDVIRWISANDAAPGNGISWSPIHELEGTITPNGLHYERHHNGIPQIAPALHQLNILGQVEQPLSFSIESLLRYPRESRICFIECGGNSNAGWRLKPVQTPAGYFHGLVSNSEWTGVPLSMILREAGLKAAAKWVIAEGADAFSMTMSLPLEKALDDCLLALYQNGERLRPAQGYPLRLLVPGYEGVLNVKWLKNLYVSDKPAMARNETSRYTELQASGKSRQFTLKMDPKSIITKPSSEMKLPQQGFYELTGLAWSGYGRVARVEVSADGGSTWLDAELAEPVLPMALTRFRSPWQWQGQAAVLQSRITDDTGRVQPARAKLLAERGRHGYFHYNAIVSWQVDESGRVSHVYPDASAAKSEFDNLFLDEEWD